MAVYSKFVGMDVHKETIVVSVVEPFGGEVRYLGEFRNTPEAVVKLIRQLRKGDANLSCCYEAGPCGYGLHRQLLEMGITNQVVAPSLIPRKAGDRIKTDRRDSQTLARLLRAGELTPVWVPDEPQEALRDLTRGREDLKHLERQAKQRLQAFLLRHGRTYGGKTKWTRMHFHWLESIKFDQPVQQVVFQDYLDTLQMLTRRVEALEGQLEVAGAASGFGPLIEGLMALRGISRIAATTTMAEIGDLHRFRTAPQLMAYLGLVPSEHSSGATRSRGGITKTGNGHVRRVLVEAAWTYHHPARKTTPLQRRAERAPEKVKEIAWKAQVRLCARYRQLESRGKLKVKVCTAIARELVGFIWAIGHAFPAPGAGTPGASSNTQCIGSRTGNGGRTLEAPM
jgi:transposase